MTLIKRCIARLYSDLFQQLESEEVLDPLDEIDMFCLPFVFVPGINKNSDEFVQSWNNHPLSTERNIDTKSTLCFILYTATERETKGVFSS